MFRHEETRADVFVCFCFVFLKLTQVSRHILCFCHTILLKDIRQPSELCARVAGRRCILKGCSCRPDAPGMAMGIKLAVRLLSNHSVQNEVPFKEVRGHNGSAMHFLQSIGFS